jgi:hypothetical protein
MSTLYLIHSGTEEYCLTIPIYAASQEIFVNYVMDHLFNNEQFIDIILEIYKCHYNNIGHEPCFGTVESDIYEFIDMNFFPKTGIINQKNPLCLSKKQTTGDELLEFIKQKLTKLIKENGDQCIYEYFDVHTYDCNYRPRWIHIEVKSENDIIHL